MYATPHNGSPAYNWFNTGLGDSMSATSPMDLILYNPYPIKITTMTWPSFSNKANSPTDINIYYCDNNANYTLFKSLSLAATNGKQTWAVDSTQFKKYYKFSLSGMTGNFGFYPTSKCVMNATYMDGVQDLNPDHVTTKMIIKY